jgi:hypothetical protein
LLQPPRPLRVLVRRGAVVLIYHLYRRRIILPALLLPLLLLSPVLPFLRQLVVSGGGGGFTPICGQSVLDSPFNYTGSTGSYSSGTAGLPTFGSGGTTFPNATAGYVVGTGSLATLIDAGTLNSAATVYYFEPGSDSTSAVTQPIFAGNNAVFIGGYASSTGVTIDGGSLSGSKNQFIEGSGTGVTLEYLTLQNFVSSANSSFINSGSAAGWTLEYDSIGPNEFGYPSGSGVGGNGGYAFDGGSNSTLEDNCFTQNQQGAFNIFGTAGNLLTGDIVDSNEISYNGEGHYPDLTCGCSGGGKMLWTTNAQFENNYVHDNYNAGVWFDFNNAGSAITGNYIASSWGIGIDVEASYNADISDNTLVGNGWASDGAWPNGNCTINSVANNCENGLGPVTGAGGGFPYGAMYFPNSGGNSLVSSNYSGQFLVESNTLTNNFGGIVIYTDPTRFAGGPYQAHTTLQSLNATYYQNTSQENSPNIDGQSADVTLNGTTLMTTANGFQTFFTNVPTTPANGMHVYDTAGDIPANDTISTCASANSCTLAVAATGSTTTDNVTLSTAGGCGLYDLFGTTGPGNSGTPSAAYWQNCIWGTQNFTISGNTFSTASASVTGCTSGALCGVMAAISYTPDIPSYWLNIYASYFVTNIAEAGSALGNVWSNNAYTWSGTGGSSAWQFEAGPQGSSGNVTHAVWQGTTYAQDAGSTGL